MSLTPLLTAPTVILVHIALALAAMLLGAFTLWRRKGDRLHKVTGRLWAAAMAGVSISSFFIPAHAGPTIAGFGLIHLLSVFVLHSLVSGILEAIRGDIARHSQTMRSLYIQALGIAGLFTFLPGRRLNVVLFGENGTLGLVVIALGCGAIFWATRRTRQATVQA